MPDFCIFMCVYNGAKYLEPQLASIAMQTEKNWELIVSDDGSKDNSANILKEFQEINFGKVKLKHANHLGFSKNFITLLVDQSISAKFYALSDQDDIWEPEKLAEAKKFLDSVDSLTPALYCSKTRYVNKNNEQIGFSASPVRALSFKNALVQNIASGNTMVINDAARNLIIKIGSIPEVYAHDWLIYMLVSGANGKMLFDNRPLVRYRQHESNLIGMSNKYRSKLKRLYQFFRGDFSKWNKKNVLFLERCSALLSEDNAKTFNLYAKATKSYGINSINSLRKSGVYRQNCIESVFLYLGACLGLL